MNSYLDQLKFDPKKFGPFLTQYVTNMRVVILLLIALVIGGTVSYFTLTRTLNPEVNITIITVATALPGASPEDVEELLTIPLEDEIESIDEIDILTSASRESASVIVVQFLDNVPRARALSDVQSAVDSATTLPSDATDSLVDAIDFEDTPVIRYALTSNTDDASLNRFAQTFKKSLENESLVDRVTVSGDEEQEVQILTSPERLAELNIDLATLARAVTAVTSSYPAGSVDTDTLSFGLTIDRSATTIASLRETNIIIGGERYTLGDIATVAQRSAPGSAGAYLTTPTDDTQKTVTLNVYRNLDSNITEVTKAVDAIRSEIFTPEITKHFTLVETLNTSTDMDEEFSGLFRNLSLTIFLVFIVLLLFVGVRQAFVAALSIPLVFMAAFIVMRITGLSLNFLSVFSLLLSLGLIVDVTIVIISALTSYFRTGRFTPQQTGLLVWKDFFTTLSVTTLTTVWAFLPLLLAGGIIGEFIKSIPIIVSSMLIASVVIGFFIILPLMVWLLDFSMPRRVRIFLSILFFLGLFFATAKIFSAFNISFPGPLWILLAPLLIILVYTIVIAFKKGAHATKRFIHKHWHKTEKVGAEYFQNGLINTRRFEAYYRKLLNSILAKRTARIKTVIAVVLFFLFSFALVPLGFVKNEFFSGDDFDLLYVTIDLPIGTKTAVTEEESLKFVENLRDIPDLLRIQTQIEASIDEQGKPTPGAGSHTILYTLQLYNKDEREHSSKEIAQIIRNLDSITSYQNGTVRVIEISGGPPAGAEVTIKLIGDNLTELDTLADRTVTYLEGQDGVLNPQKSIKSGAAKIVFTPRKESLANEGLTNADLGALMRSYNSGFTIEKDATFSDIEDEQDIILRLSDDVHDVATLGRLSVPLFDGSRVPLTALGTLTLAPNPTVITREDTHRTISVTADVEDGYNAGEINAALGTFADNELDLPADYTWQSGGANEENNKSIQSILQAMLLAFILIFLTLIIRLNSYRKSAIVLLVIPLAVSGVFIVFAIVGLPLSFPALIGILALFGIVINNSIIIIDQINRNLKEKINFHDAVVDGATSRFEPILLSSLTTIIGLAPITFSEPVWQGLGGAIIAGLIFSGTIMLFFIPTVFYMMFHKEETKN